MDVFNNLITGFAAAGTLENVGFALIGCQFASAVLIQKNPHQIAKIARAEPDLAFKADGVHVFFLADEEHGDVGWVSACIQKCISLVGAAVSRRQTIGWQLHAGWRTGKERPADPKISRIQQP